MLILAASGVYMVFLKSQTSNIIGGAVTFYRVITAWGAARRRDGETGMFDWGALLVALAIGVGCIWYGFAVARNPRGATDGVPAGMDFFFGLVVLLAAAGDVRMLARGGVFGTQRKANVVFIPAILPLILMIFWLLRVHFKRAIHRSWMFRGGNVASLQTYPSSYFTASRAKTDRE